MVEADQEGVRPWGNPWGAPQFGSAFFMITGFHGTHVTIGVIFLLIVARKVWRGDYDDGRRGFFTSRQRRLRECRGHGPLLALRRPGLGLHLRLLLSLVGQTWRKPQQTGMATGTATTPAVAAHDDHTQHHPLRTYFIVWFWLFVLSACSYMVDYLELQGFLRWFLILTFMMLKAGLIVAFFMHMAWERLALVYAILIPPVALLVFVAIMAIESDYTFLTRDLFFGPFNAEMFVPLEGGQLTSTGGTGSRNEDGGPEGPPFVLVGIGQPTAVAPAAAPERGRGPGPRPAYGKGARSNGRGAAGRR